ncbi:MAG: hypothetical protein CMJ20_06850 [Phycisphaeraceae bacterium]|nr:hypothetical protein [Phycisphaeraceae bacterium]
MTHKHMHTIDAFGADGLEIIIQGKDGRGRPFSVSFVSIEFLQYVETDQIKEKLIEYIKAI